MNIKYQSKHNHSLYNYYIWATCFDSLESSSGPTKTDPRLSKCILILILINLYAYIYNNHTVFKNPSFNVSMF